MNIMTTTRLGCATSANRKIHVHFWLCINKYMSLVPCVGIVDTLAAIRGRGCVSMLIALRSSLHITDAPVYTKYCIPVVLKSISSTAPHDAVEVAGVSRDRRQRFWEMCAALYTLPDLVAETYMVSTDDGCNVSRVVEDGTTAHGVVCRGSHDSHWLLLFRCLMHQW